MLTVSELLKFECCKNFKIFSGKNGLNKEITGVGILEYEMHESNGSFKNFFIDGNFILTTLFFAKESKAFAEEAIIKLLDNVPISGLAIKSIYYDDFSDNVKNHANKRAVPLFVFKDTFFEDIIVTIFEIPKINKYNKIIEEKVDKLLKQEVGKTMVMEIAKEINDSFYNNIICAYCIEKDYKDNVNILEILEKLRLNMNQRLSRVGTSIIKYENGILIIYSFEDEEERTVKNKLKETIEELITQKDDFYIGISDIHNISELDICIKKSIYASLSCKDKQILCCCFKNTGIDKIILPLKNNYWVSSYCKDILEPIIEYDTKYNGNLLETAIAYINNGGRVEATSKELYQHRNTIRYRIQNIKQVTGITEEDDFYVQLFLAIKLYLYLRK